MDNTQLNISFSGLSRAAIDPILRSAEIIIPYFEASESKGEASAIAFACSMHTQAVVSFVGMVQDLLNKSGGSAVITNGQGDTVKLSKGKPDFHFGELEKLLQPVL